MPYRYALIDADGKVLQFADDMDVIKQRAGEELEAEEYTPGDLHIYTHTYIPALQTTVVLSIPDPEED